MPDLLPGLSASTAGHDCYMYGTGGAFWANDWSSNCILLLLFEVRLTNVTLPWTGGRTCLWHSLQHALFYSLFCTVQPISIAGLVCIMARLGLHVDVYLPEEPSLALHEEGGSGSRLCGLTIRQHMQTAEGCSLLENRPAVCQGVSQSW